MAPVEGAAGRALQLVDDFMAERWERVQEDFSTRMREAVPLDLLKSTRARIERQWGALLDVGQPAVTVRPGYTVVDVPLAFERDDSSGQATFSIDGEVAGLLFLRSETGRRSSQAAFMSVRLTGTP
jgi:hypothetical protein